MFNKTIGIGVYRFLLMAGVIALLFLNTKYVPREEYAKDKAELEAKLQVSNEKVSSQLESMRASIAEINTTLKIMAQQDNVLKDHETRLRYIEMKVK